MDGANAVVEAVADGARRATGAAGARLVTSFGEELVVASVAGEIPEWQRGESVGSDDEGLRFVLGVGQPYSIAGAEDGGRPLLCVPCQYDSEPMAALELVRNPGESPFPIEATDVAMLFARIAATALAESDGAADSAPTPQELTAELVRLAAGDPVRYASIARAVRALLA